MKHNSFITVVGNRPQFIKLAPIYNEFQRRSHKPIILHTGQHHDYNLSQIFFDELNIPKPDIHLTIKGSTHGQMTAEMLMQIENVFLDFKPQGILLFGDTNSTLAAALAAVKLKIPIAHVEAGPRLYNLQNPEEINRVITDKISNILFCPDLESVQNLKSESIKNGVYFTGDVMYDAYLLFSKYSIQKSTIIQTHELTKNNFILVTIHRAENTDTQKSLLNLIDCFEQSSEIFVFPIHPRTESALKKYNLLEKIYSLKNVKSMAPLGYIDLLALLNSSKMVITDSGGLQKESYFAEKPTLVCFYTTPWPQLNECGWQKIVGTLDQMHPIEIIHQIQNFKSPSTKENFFGDGSASKKIVDILENYHLL